MAKIPFVTSGGKARTAKGGAGKLSAPKKLPKPSMAGTGQGAPLGSRKAGTSPMIYKPKGAM